MVRRRLLKVGMPVEIQDSFVFWKRIEYLIRFLRRNEGKFYDETIVFIATITTIKERQELLRGFSHSFEKVQWEEDSEFDNFIDEMDELHRKGRYSQKIKKIVANFLEGKLKSAGRIKKDFTKKQLDELQKVFSLSDDEIEMLLIVYLSKGDNAFEDFFCDYNSNSDVSKRITLIHMLSGIPMSQIRQFLNEKSSLRRYGLVDENIDLPSHLNEFLAGLTSNSLSTEYFNLCKGGKIPLAEHNHVQKDLEIIKPMIQNRCKGEALNLLIYGPPGTGKTELCKSLAADLGMKLYQVKLKSNGRESSDSFRFTALNACMNCVDTEKSIILIDEADEMLNGSGGLFMFSRNVSKGVLNEIIDNGNAICIWVTNLAYYIDPSTKRRFDYSIEFKPLTPSIRRKMWASCIAKSKLKRVFKDKYIEYLAEEYDINTGGITLALKNYKRIARKRPANKTPMQTLEAIIQSHLKVMNFSDAGKKKQKFNDGKYCLKALNYKSSISLEDSLMMMQTFYKKVYETEEQNLYSQNMNLLMYGPPGTGKTEFVKYMANHIACKVVEKSGSTLLDMYVGGTEKNIREAFREAEEEKAILFIDEADGLIGDRRSAQRSWEVTQVNEFLKQMENFKGILVCATNFKKNLDAASIRRFSMKIEFDYLKDEGKEILYQRLLAPMVSQKVTEKDLNALKKIQFLTPGDFKVAIQKFAFFPQKLISHKALITALSEEVESKNNVSSNRIGFSLEL